MFCRCFVSNVFAFTEFYRLSRESVADVVAIVVVGGNGSADGGNGNANECGFGGGGGFIVPLIAHSVAKVMVREMT